jgi:hypothetical protein
MSSAMVVLDPLPFTLCPQSPPALLSPPLSPGFLPELFSPPSEFCKLWGLRDSYPRGAPNPATFGGSVVLIPAEPPTPQPLGAPWFLSSQSPQPRNLWGLRGSYTYEAPTPQPLGLFALSPPTKRWQGRTSRQPCPRNQLVTMPFFVLVGIGRTPEIFAKHWD